MLNHKTTSHNNAIKSLPKQKLNVDHFLLENITRVFNATTTPITRANQKQDTLMKQSRTSRNNACNIVKHKTFILNTAIFYIYISSLPQNLWKNDRSSYHSWSYPMTPFSRNDLAGGFKNTRNKIRKRTTWERLRH